MGSGEPEASGGGRPGRGLDFAVWGLVIATLVGVAAAIVCDVLHESPVGAGFADAALASTRDARIEPRRIDGVTTDSTIIFTVRFLMAPAP